MFRAKMYKVLVENISKPTGTFNVLTVAARFPWTAKRRARKMFEAYLEEIDIFGNMRRDFYKYSIYRHGRL